MENQIPIQSGPLKILLVEDSRADAILIEKAVRQTITSLSAVHKAESLSAALRTLTEENFDIVLLDLSLTDTVGFNGLLSIQNIAPNLPIVILTAHEDENTALAAVQHGAQDYLYKDKLDGATLKRAISFAIQRKFYENTLITRAHFDPLTGLANRTLFEGRLDIALARRTRSHEGFGVFFLDLDRFKQVNDQMGHEAGDQLLKEVGQRLVQSVRPYDTVARFGGDEFALLIDGIRQIDNCTTIATNIIRRLSEPVAIMGRTAEIGVSIGIATCLTEESTGRDALLRQADTAMYAAKQVPNSAYCIFEPGLEEKIAAANENQGCSLKSFSI